MTRLRIRHETRYQYDRPVRFGRWRLVMRPADSHALRVVEARFEFTPPAETFWLYDAYGNSVCELAPQGESDRLVVVNHLVIDRYPNPMPAPTRVDPHSLLPIQYDNADRVALEPFIRPAAQDDGALADWAGRVAHAPGSLALDQLHTINSAIHQGFTYAAREAEGVQSPAQTLQLGAGSCRDFAWLMIETARRLGFAARFVTGYLFSENAGVRGTGATHAWCEVFLPRLGWLEFDPTNGLAESSDLVRVAATRTPEEASPMRGEIEGQANAQLFVAVDVERL